RYFGWRLFKKLRVLCRGNDEKAMAKLQLLKIHHVHGRMLPLSALEAQSQGLNHSCYAPYGLEDSSLEQQRLFGQIAKEYAATSFKTIYTNSEQPDEMAVAAIKWAKRVFFLGFGYDDKNMLKLGINVEGITYDWSAKYVA